MIAKTTALLLLLLPLPLVLLSASAIVAAAAKSPSDAHYKTGMKAFAAEDYLTAAEDLAASIQVHPNANTALYLGNAYLKLGQLGKATEAFKQVLQIDPTTPKREEILKLIQNIESRNVGIVKITTTPAGATIYLHEKTARASGKTPLELSLPPGTHRVIAELDAYEAASREVQVTFGETVALDLALHPVECELSMASTPLGSRAAVDQAGAVEVPAIVRVRRGDHRVTFSAWGFASKELSVRCAGTGPTEVLRARVDLERPPRYALKAAVALTAFAALSEALALVVHFQLPVGSPDSVAYETQHNTELGLHIAAGSMAAGAIVGYVLEFALARSSAAQPDPRTPRIGAAPLPQGGALVLGGHF